MKLSFVGVALSTMALFEVGSSAECLTAAQTGFGFDTLRMNSGVIVAQGGWENAALWSTDIVIDAGDGIMIKGKYPIDGGNLNRGGGGNDVLIGCSGNDKCACKIKFSALFYGGEGDPLAIKFFQEKIMPLDGLGPKVETNEELLTCAVSSDGIKVPKNIKGMIKSGKFKADCFYLREQKCIKAEDAGTIELNGLLKFVCPKDPPKDPK